MLFIKLIKKFISNLRVFFFLLVMNRYWHKLIFFNLVLGFLLELELFHEFQGH